MARIPRETVDRILDTVRIEEVVGEFVNLKKSGSSLKGLSPFTQEKTPSFYVSPSKQIFKCFSSGKGGSAVTFLMEHEQFTYPEALRWLAKKYNIEVQEEEVTTEQQQQNTERESLQRVNEFAAGQFAEWLWDHPKGQAIGLAYFRERGFTDATLKTFQLGFSLEDRDALYQSAVSKGYQSEFLEKTGLCLQRENGSWADRFFGRVMFPILSQSGRVLGFGGRILRSDAKAAKYVNSPESELYSKSKTLYGLYQARQSIVRENKCLLVEGYTDVLRLHQSGITHAVSSSGTALTVDQIRLIRRYTDQVTVLYDGDAAGIRASFRGIDLLLEQGLKVRVLLFPDGEDPDSFARALAPEALRTYLQSHETDFIRFKAEVLAKDAAEDPIKRALLAKDLISSVARVQDLLLRDVYLRECATVLGMDERVLNQELQLTLTRLANESQRSAAADQQRAGLTVVRPNDPAPAGPGPDPDAYPGEAPP
ncbi:MAG: DNA primase, partial [Schleiferiaceae bacterium]|nr:DNA primase [Schleiferiaceae bacterium]